MMFSRWAEISHAGLWLRIAALTAAIELLTVFFRFGLKLESQKHTSWLAPFTFGFRVHHGFTGLALLLAALFIKSNAGLRNVLIIVGAALVFSDAIHHFLVLWPITGYHDFYLWYD